MNNSTPRAPIGFKKRLHPGHGHGRPANLGDTPDLTLIGDTWQVGIES